MDNINSQLTEQYKKEVADILSSISIGLSETVIKKIEPEINTLVKDFKNIRTILSDQKNEIDGLNKKQDNLIIDISKNNETSSMLLNSISLGVNILPEKLDLIASNSELKNQLKEVQLNQKKMFKFVYLLLFLLTAFFISVVSIFIFQYNQIG